jgi:5'-nucleotidase
MSFKSFTENKQYLGFKGGIFDLDNTFYSYPPCNDFAKKELFRQTQTELGVSAAETEAAFDAARNEIHQRLSGTASMHSRFLYIQRMLEMLSGRTLLEKTMELNTLFWNAYFSKMELRPWVKPMLVTMKEAGLKTAILTDLTVELQFKKIEALGIQNLVDWMITSEEAGREKPSEETMLLALNKLSLKPSEVFYVGDHPVKDRLGEAMGIQTFIID